MAIEPIASRIPNAATTKARQSPALKPAPQKFNRNQITTALKLPPIPVK